MNAQATDIMYSFVAPVYNEAAGLEKFYQRLKKVAEQLREGSRGGENYEIIFVNDGSTDESLRVIRTLAQRDGSVKFVDFSRNFGHQAAVTAGYDLASGRAVITLDSDCQHPPEIIPQLVERWQGGAEVVYTVRRDTEGVSPARRWLGRAVCRVISRCSGLDVVDQADFRLLDHKVVAAIRSMREQARFVRGLVRWVGFKQAAVPYKAERRGAGQNSYTFPQRMRLALAGLLNFSVLPMRAIGALGAGFIAIALGYLLVAGVLSIFGVGSVSGLFVLAMLLSGTNLLGLFTVGEYVGRIYEEAKGRPLYVVRYAHGFESDEVDAPEPPERLTEGAGRFSVLT